MFYRNIFLFYFHILMVKTYGPGFGPLKKKLPFGKDYNINEGSIIGPKSGRVKCVQCLVK